MLNKLIEKHQGIAPPSVLNERYIFNPAALASPRGKPLPVIAVPQDHSSASRPLSLERA